jgi:hypothetical protein
MLTQSSRFRVVVSVLMAALAGTIARAGQEQDASGPPYLLNPDVTRTVRTFALNGYEAKLDGQWEGSRVASDGKVYFASSTHAHDTSGIFCQYDPATQQVHLLAQSLSAICHEDPTADVPQGKLHSDITEHDGWLYTATHLANYWEPHQSAYTGSHVLAYQLGSYEAGAPVFRDFGVVRANHTCYSAVTVDPVNDYVYVQVTRWWGTTGTYLYRYKTDGTGKTLIGSLPGPCFYHFIDSRGDLWFAIQSNSRTLYKVTGSTGAISTYPNAIPYRRNLTSDTPNMNLSGNWWEWGDRRDGDRYIFKMFDDGGIWEFDSSKMQDGDASDAFRQLHWLIIPGLNQCLAGDTLYFLRPANPARTHQAKASDHHLWSVSLEPGSTPRDWGRIVDQAGRTPWRCEGLSADRAGNFYLTGDWRLLRDAQGNLLESGTVRHNDSNPGTYWYADMWRGQFFTVANIPEAQVMLNVQSTPLAGFAITGAPAGTTNYSAQVANGMLVTLVAPSVAAPGGTDAVFDCWTLNGAPQAAGQTTLTFVISQDSTAQAAYHVVKRTITVQSAPITGVAIEGTSAGKTNYTAQCDDNSEVELTAPMVVVAGGVTYGFVHWTLNGVNRPDGEAGLTFAINQDSTASAVYAPARMLNVESIPISGVDITGTAPGITDYSWALPHNTQVTLTAPQTVSTGDGVYTFQHWTLNGTVLAHDQTILNFVMGSDTYAVAVYVKTATLAVQSVPITNVHISGDIPGDTNYSAPAPTDATVKLQAPVVAHSGGASYSFLGWVLNGVEQPAHQTALSLTMDADSTVVANYEASPLNMTYPDEEGITIKRGAKCTIAWVSGARLTKKSVFRIGLVNSAGASWLLTSKAKNKGTCKWSTGKWKSKTLPVFPDGTDYKIRISLPTGEILDESKEAFAITTPANFVPEAGDPTE